MAGRTKWKTAPWAVLGLVSMLVTGILYAHAQDVPRVKWKYPMGGVNCFSAPAIGQNGTIYAGSDDGKLYAFHPNGSKKWEYQLSEIGTVSTPVVGRDGSVYVTSTGQSGFLHAISAAGVSKWSLPVFQPQGRAIGSDGTLFFADGTGLYAIDPETGQGRIVSNTLGCLALAIAQDGTLYCAYGSGLKAILPTGFVKWEFQSGMVSLTSPPSIAKDGTIYVGYSDGWDSGIFYAVRPSDGGVKWSYDATLASNGAPAANAIGLDGTIYFGSSDRTYGKFHALNPDGTLKWEIGNEPDYPYYGLGSGAHACPCIGDDGTIYVGWGSQKFFAIHPATGTISWELRVDGPAYGSPVLDENGIIYATTQNGNLYAIQSGSHRLANTPWPMLARDRRHSARAGGSASMIWDSAYNQLFDDSSDLVDFRRYRDEVLLLDPRGKNLVSELYGCSHVALRILLEHPALLIQAKALVDANKNAVAAALQGCKATIHNSQAISSFLKEFKAVSPPPLEGLVSRINRSLLECRRKGKPFCGFLLQ